MEKIHSINADVHIYSDRIGGFTGLEAPQSEETETAPACTETEMSSVVSMIEIHCAR